MPTCNKTPTESVTCNKNSETRVATAAFKLNIYIHIQYKMWNFVKQLPVGKVLDGDPEHIS